MKGMFVLRILIAFPLISLGIPDLIFKIHDSLYIIPLAHYYIFAILAVVYLFLLIDPVHRFRKKHVA
jgi:hypothetical protein